MRTSRLAAALLALTAGAALLTGMAAPAVVPASRPAVRFGEVRLATGVWIRYAEQGDPAGEPVILLHGLSDSWFSWSRVLPLFPSGWRVYALDQRGHGDSDRPESGYTARDLAADVVAFLDAKGIGRATVVGHSMGGIVAQHVAAIAPERLSRLVLVASAGGLREMNGALEFEQAVMALTDPVSTAFAREFQESTIHRPLPKEFVDRTVVESLKLPARVWHTLTADMMASPPAEVPVTRFPVLMFWGTNDAVFSREAEDRLQARIPRGRLVVYPETGHAVHWERPEEFAAELRDFMNARAR
ncbi:MAG TPA: alpha/beta hydrolase [Gemmatimonadales bacterium]|nr:alpha/beta hydrolase [Gemmatimonadales bacterium]